MMQLKRTLYITEPDVSLGVEGETLRIDHPDGQKDKIPLHLLESIISFTYRSVSQKLMTVCARKGIGLYFFSPQGQLNFRVVGNVEGNVLLRMQQYEMSKADDASLAVAREMIRGKIENDRLILERFRKNHPQLAQDRFGAVMQDLRETEAQAMKAKTKDGLRGLEGTAARLYFGVLDNMILSEDPKMHFTTRTRRPPEDPCNAMLSFVYTMLTTDCVGALTAAGLDPYVGFLHGVKPGKPSLALDLMEEMRPLLADRLVMRLINLKMVSSEDFEDGPDGGIWLNKEGKKTVVREWNKMKQEEVSVVEYDGKVKQGLFPHLQAQQLARYIRGETAEYNPIRMR